MQSDNGVRRSRREAVAACREVNAEFRLQGPDGTWRWTNVRAAPVRDAAGQIYKWVGMNIDITDRKQAEGALQEADQRKDEFLATLAHELRNPLVPLRSGLDALKLSNDKPEDIAQIRTMMERQLNHMIRLIDDLLDISRINRGKMDLKLENNINLNNILQTAVESVQPLIQEAGQEFTIKMTDEPLYVKADPVRLTQVFSNLLNNATKFTPEGGHIQLNIECKAKEVLVRVRDNGSGIASDMLPQIFDLFMQADQTTKVKHSGLGIGLTLVKRLVGMHGGTVEARSDGPGLGSEFIVRLPSTNEAMPVEQDDRDEKVLRDSDARRILIVDDEPDVLHSLNMLLNIMGNVTRIADNGMDALQIGAEFKPDIVIMDLGMPDMSGYDAAREIRKQDWAQQISLIALSGWGEEKSRESSKQAGFDFHLVKPVTAEQLKSVITSLSKPADAK